eukprot:6210233-Pleurochrysis_carterae.AAC.1
MTGFTPTQGSRGKQASSHTVYGQMRGVLPAKTLGMPLGRPCRVIWGSRRSAEVSVIAPGRQSSFQMSQVRPSTTTSCNKSNGQMHHPHMFCLYLLVSDDQRAKSAPCKVAMEQGCKALSYQENSAVPSNQLTGKIFTAMAKAKAVYCNLCAVKQQSYQCGTICSK